MGNVTMSCLRYLGSETTYVKQLSGVSDPTCAEMAKCAGAPPISAIRREIPATCVGSRLERRWTDDLLKETHRTDAFGTAGRHGTPHS